MTRRVDARTQALLVDFTLAALALALGVLGGGVAPAPITLALAAFGLVVLVAPLALTEHSRVLDTLDENSPLSFLVVFAATFVLTLVLVAGRTVARAPVATLLVGMGVGLIAYRAVYGLVRPLPDRRLAQARWLRGVDRFERDGPGPP